MNNETLYYPVVDPECKMVRCRFKGNTKNYVFKCLLPVRKGDWVVALIADETNASVQSYGICRVTDPEVPIPIENSNTRFKWIVAVIDSEARDDLLAREKALVGGSPGSTLLSCVAGMSSQDLRSSFGQRESEGGG